MQAYIAKGNNPNHEDSQKRTPLMFASGYGHLKVCKVLVESGAMIDHGDAIRGMNSLHRACARGHQKVVSYLIQKNADLLMTSKAGQSALHYAAQFGWHACIRVIIDALQAQCLLSEALLQADQEGMMPVHLAAKWGKAEVLRDLFNTRDSSGNICIHPNLQTLCDSQWTCAHLAARWDHLHVIQELEKANASFDVMAGFPEPMTPLDMAISWKRATIAHYLDSL